MTKSEYQKIIEKINMPDSPGVYFFRDGDTSNDAAGNIIYIGKATSLKDRTRSYFSPDLKDTRGLKIVNMVVAAENITFTKTESVLEALLLENVLIKKHQPNFNTKEKDDRTFTCIVITKEEYPRVLIMRVRDYEKRFVSKAKSVREIVGGGASGATLEKIDKVYGPFTNGNQIREAMKIIRKIFPYRDRCEALSGKSCFNAQIKLCPGMCAGLISKEEYKKNIKHIKDMFEGKMTVIKKDLEKEMKQAVKMELFEKAIKIRNTMWALDHVRDVSLIKDDNDYNENINIDPNKTFRIEGYDVAHISGTSRVGVMTVVESGIKNTGEYKKFKLEENTNDDYAGIVEILKRRLKHTEWSYPDLIVIDGGIGQKNIAEKVIANLGLNIRVVSVVKDDRHKARDILGIENIIGKKIDLNKKENSAQDENLKKSIILANSEAHRFAIKYHREKREKII